MTQQEPGPQQIPVSQPNTGRHAGAFTLGGMNAAQRTEFWASLALRHTARLGPRTWKRLLEVYPSPYAAVLDAANWAQRCGIAARLVSEFRSEKWRGPARLEWEAAGAGGWRVLLWTDARYPQRLREIADPPIFLYYEGDAGLLSNPGVGVVGSRSCSRDGIATTRELCRRLSVSGVTTVSGLARGIDSEAHRAALAGWGSTIAVLGTGPDCVYPPENGQLHAAIREGGLILSEFAPGTVPEARNFPMRNRIISGLSLGVLVVEAAKRSGSLITAKHALEQGREVFAVPGSVRARTSSGCHDLIRQGAKAVFCCDDVLVEIAPLLGMSITDWPAPGEVSRSGRDDFLDDSLDDARDEAGDDVGDGAEAASVPARRHGGRAARRGPGSGNVGGNAFQGVPGARREGGQDVEQGASCTDDMTPDEKLAYDLLATCESLHIDELCRSLSWQAGKASGVLLMLEVQGAVRQLPGMHYSVTL